MRTQIVLISTLLALPFTALNASPLECTNWQTAHPNWLWCDDFEVDSSLEENYFEVYRANGRYGVDSEEAFGGNASLRSDWVPGSSDAGNLKFSKPAYKCDKPVTAFSTNVAKTNMKRKSF